MSNFSTGKIHASPTGDPFLLTPGPLTTSESVKRAMLHDFGSRDLGFIDLNARIMTRITDMVDGNGTHITVPVQGSGTFAVEAMIGSFLPRDGKLLICINGAYGERMARICDYLDRNYVVLTCAEDVPVSPVDLDQMLENDAAISHVVAVYCETTSGILNPIQQLADVVERHNRGFLIDAMSAFGALPLSSKNVRFDAIVASSNKCLEGVPGMGFCIAKADVLAQTKGNSHSLSLDLYSQWQGFENNAQWRFTPPTHVLLALDQAINEFDSEGGVAGRGARYQKNCDILIAGMRAMGFKTLLKDDLQAPIIITFHMPADNAFEFERFYNRLRNKGFVIYPGKLTVADSFRIGCIGRLGAEEMEAALATIRVTLDELGIGQTVSY